MRVTGNSATDTGGTDAFTEGGGIENNTGAVLHLVLSTVDQNSATASGATNQNAASGGGIMNRGTLTLDRSTVDSNQATGISGGASTNVGGGAIGNDGTLVIKRSTVSNNTVSASAGASFNSASGGGISNFNDALNVDVTIDRSTVGNNSVTASGAGSSSQGGGMQSADGDFAIRSSTFAQNAATAGANLLISGNLPMKNSIVADPSVGPNCDGTATSGGYNISDGGTCGFGAPTDQPSTDPMLAASLGDNGGPTQTYALQPGSPAIDKGLSSTGETLDQRGITRPSDFASIANAPGGDGTDIGAFELSDPNAVIDSGPTGITNDPTPKFTFHVVDGASTLQCKIDAKPFAGCASPKTVAHLADGSHTFQVRGRDALGNVDPTPASRSFTVKTAAISRSGSTLLITAAAGAKDNLRITQPSASTIKVSDAPSSPYSGSGVHTVVGSGCVRSGDYSANCDAAGVTLIKVNSGALTDKVTNLTAKPSTLIGGPDADVLTGGSVNDTLNGGTGADSFKGMNGNDILLARDGASDALIHCEGSYARNPADKAVLDALPNDPDSIVYGCETKLRP